MILILIGCKYIVDEYSPLRIAPLTTAMVSSPSSRPRLTVTGSHDSTRWLSTCADVGALGILSFDMVSQVIMLFVAIIACFAVLLAAVFVVE